MRKSIRERKHLAGWLAALVLAILFMPRSSAAADPLQELLTRAGQQVSAFLELISDMNCTEHVTQVKLGDSGKVVEKQESAFDYLILLSNTGGELNLSESRLPADPKAAPKDKSPLLLSNGF